MAGDKVRVGIIDQTSSKKYTVILPTNVPVSQLRPALVKHLGLPPGRYGLWLDTKEWHTHLGEDKTLGDSHVQDGAVLRIIPERRAIPVDLAIFDPDRPIGEEWKYLDFELQISHARKRYQAEVLVSPAGEASETFVPPDRMRVENFILRISRTRHGVRRINSPEWLAAQDFGQDLFQRMFRGEILARLTASLQEAQGKDCGLRLKLRLDRAPDLMSIPWEFLYNPSRRIFLASQENMPIVRFINVGEQRRPMRVELPLRILAMASSPADLLELKVDDEYDKLTDALGPLISTGLVEVDWVKGGSMSALYQHLVKTAERHHIFHFIGHGRFDQGSGQGFLAMEGSERHYEAITGPLLAPLLLAGKRRFRLVVLNACEGARTSLTDPFAGVATSLVLACGLPAVVAMQFEITDAAAITFASNFYGALATGRPVDTAVTAARLAIWAAHNDVEWGTPVLYMRSPDGQLFDLGARQAG